MHNDHYAPTTTLLGLLQRGRGNGALIAAEDRSSVADLVYACIRWDWRWDRQVDHRDLYLARLIRDLELPLAPVVDLLAGDEGTRHRATSVLELLIAGGSEEARRALLDYTPAEDKPASHTPAKREDPYPDRDNAALLALLRDPDTTEDTKASALLSLSLRPPEHALLPLVPELGVADGTRPLPLLAKALERFAGDAVPAAREWAASNRPWLAEIGFTMLAAHGDESDIPALLAELERRWVDQAWCGPDELARGLARFGPKAADAVSLLRRFWLSTPHSHERPDYLEALAAMGAAGLPEAYAESLYDCEPRARLLAVQHAPDRPYALRKIAYLRDDPMEEPEVRAAAAARLTGAA